MYISSIELENFRNYKSETVNFHRDVNIFTGENAQGKTNLLESIYMTSMGRSFRTPREKELIRFEEKACRIKAFFEREEGPCSVEIAIGKEGKKGIRADNIKIKKLSDLFENVSVIVFSPEDLRIVKDEPEKRRNFIDRELSQLRYSYLDDIIAYKKILNHRNAFLKSKKEDEDEIYIWDRGIAEKGADIIRKRTEFIKRLDEISRGIHKKITSGSEELKIKYDCNINCAGQEDPAGHILEVLSRDRKKDIYYGNTGRGPHKDDLELFINGVNIRKYGSQGQQKTAALSMKMAEIALIEKEKYEKPILLLDDVFSELDEERQKQLISSLDDTQLIITTTELSPAIKENLRSGKEFAVNNGNILQKA